MVVPVPVGSRVLLTRKVGSADALTALVRDVFDHGYNLVETRGSGAVEFS